MPTQFLTAKASLHFQYPHAYVYMINRTLHYQLNLILWTKPYIINQILYYQPNLILSTEPYTINCTLQIFEAETFKQKVHTVEWTNLAISNFWNNSPTSLNFVHNRFLKFAYFHIILFSEGIQYTHLCWNISTMNEYTTLAEHTVWVDWIMIYLWYVKLRQRPLWMVVTHSHIVSIPFKKEQKEWLLLLIHNLNTWSFLSVIT